MLQTDERILKIITSDPCLTQVEVAQKAGVTRDTCRRAEERLKKAGLLRGRGYVLPSPTSLPSIVPDPKVVAVLGSPSDAHEIDEFEALLEAQKKIGRIFLVTGGDADYVVLSNFAVDTEEYNSFIKEVRRHLGKNTSSHVVASSMS